ncbi:hypothetical protein HBA_0354 [Sodalis endosymbiont of Henestaris halophilus]|nr:hypothetical protein HBA_0354 [Sodalis endosymbiont of Henestaris halophilus]
MHDNTLRLRQMLNNTEPTFIKNIHNGKFLFKFANIADCCYNINYW